MATSEIITSTKYGPAVAVSLVVGSNSLFIATYLEWLMPGQAALLLPTVFTVLLILYRIFLQHNCMLNFQWLKYFRNLEPDIRLKPDNLRDEKSSQTLHLTLTVTNNTYHNIKNYLVFLYIPTSYLPSASSFPTEDKQRSTSTHKCFRLPGPNEKEPPEISKSEPRHMGHTLVFQKASINKDSLKQYVRYIMVTEGLVTADVTSNFSELMKISESTDSKIKLL